MSESRVTDARSSSSRQEAAASASRSRDAEGHQGTPGGGAPSDQAGTPDLGTIGQEAVSQAQEQAVKIVSQVREHVTDNVSTKAARVSGIAAVLGTTLHDAGKQLREQDDAAVATFFDQAADQVEQIGAMLDNQEYGKLIATVQGFAQRQPVLFFAAAIAVGVAGARFLRSSSPAAPAAPSGPDADAGPRARQDTDAQAGGRA